jgi:energy-coupling factor transport system ATP-binding protein
VPAAELSRVSYRRAGAHAPALRDVSLRLQPGQLVLLAGATGSGKSTLLRVLCGLVPHFHGGTFAGRCIVGGLDTSTAPVAQVCARAGIVFQDPEAGALMLGVEREVAFGLQNRGVPTGEISARVESALADAGAAGLLGRRLATLSGGELQRVALAAALATDPQLVLLDEPTSQLDPNGADDLARRLRTLCAARGACVVVADHRTERLAAVADRVIVLAGGRIVADGPPHDTPLPASAPPPLARPTSGGAVLARLDGVEAGYGGVPLVRELGLDLRAGTVTALHGPNGAGKSTLARVLAGLHAPSAGTVEVLGRDVTDLPAERRFPQVGYLGQDPGRGLLRERVRDEVAYGLRHAGLASADIDARLTDWLQRLGLTALADEHPRDLSGGERERVALASVLAPGPAVLVLDEPTRGMDAEARAVLVALLRSHAANGGAALIVTHDAGIAEAVADVRLELQSGQLRPLPVAVTA